MTKKTYAEAYATLKSVADKFRNGGPGDVDSLVDSFRIARDAYNFCRDRLDEIQREIEEEIHRGSDREPPAGSVALA